MPPTPFAELDWAETPWGTLVLRRRFDPATQREVDEVKLGDDYLMSSQFTVSEVELARLGMAAAVGQELRVLVGGLGLGYTAGVFGLWSDEPPDPAMVELMRGSFAEAEAHVVSFDNPLTGGVSSCTVYLATGPRLAE